MPGDSTGISVAAAVPGTCVVDSVHRLRVVSQAARKILKRRLENPECTTSDIFAAEWAESAPDLDGSECDSVWKYLIQTHCCESSEEIPSLAGSVEQDNIPPGVIKFPLARMAYLPATKLPPLLSPRELRLSKIIATKYYDPPVAPKKKLAPSPTCATPPTTQAWPAPKGDPAPPVFDKPDADSRLLSSIRNLSAISQPRPST